MKNTKNQIKVDQERLAKNEQKKILGGGNGSYYYCTKCNFISAVNMLVCPECGSVGGFAVT